MKAEILAVGTEILIGDIVNTNAQFLSRRLFELGIDSTIKPLSAIIRHV